MIPNEEKKGWHYLAVGKLSALLHGIICHNSLGTENLKSYEKLCKNKDLCGTEMPSEKDNALEFNE